MMTRESRKEGVEAAAQGAIDDKDAAAVTAKERRRLHMQKLNKIGRYLLGCPRLVPKFA